VHRSLPPPAGPLRALLQRHEAGLHRLRPFLSPTAFQALRCWVIHGERLPVDAPTLFRHHLFLKLARDRSPLLPRTADKALVRDYVAAQLGPGHLPACYAVLERAEALRDVALPARYVAKATVGSGQQQLVEADGPAVRAALVTAARGWLARRNYGVRNGEWAYESLVPRIIVEEWLDDGVHRIPPDWKWFCFHGTVGIVEYDGARYTRERWRNLYTPDGEQLDARLQHPPGPRVPVPDAFGAMRRIAERLSAPFDFVRIDLYALPDRIVVGEFTHYPAAGRQRFEPEAWEHRLGALWRERAAAHAAGHGGLSPTSPAGATAARP
jgi:hypothetical protein